MGIIKNLDSGGATKTDVNIKFNAKNHPYRLIFKSIRVKIAKNMFPTVCTQLYTIVNVYPGFVTLFLHVWVVIVNDKNFT